MKDIIITTQGRSDCPSSGYAPHEEVCSSVDLACLCSPHCALHAGMAQWAKSRKGLQGTPSLPLNHGTVAVLLVLRGGFFDPFSILLAGVASLKGLRLLAEVGEQAGRKCCFPEQEGEAHWHSTSELSFTWCWRRVRDTICGKSKLKCKCDVWKGQHNIWTWTQSWALFSVCPHILSYASKRHLSADDPQSLFWTPHLCVQLPTGHPASIHKRHISLACSKKLLTFLSKAALLFFFLLGRCLLQSFTYLAPKPGPPLSVPSFSHISRPIKPHILSAVLWQYVWHLTNFHCLTSVSL